jgi:ketosteroid isomerase-like protein
MILLRFSGRNSPVPDALHCENGMKLQLALQHRLTQSVSSACWSARRIVSREIGMNMGTDDGMDVKALIDRWAKAVREGDKAGVRADHDSEMLMLDVPPPLLSRGLDEYMATWNRFLSWSDKPVAFDFYDVTVTARERRGICYGDRAMCRYRSCRQTRKLEFRLTMGLHKIDEKRRILHERHSLLSE